MSIALAHPFHHSPTLENTVPNWFDLVGYLGAEGVILSATLSLCSWPIQDFLESGARKVRHEMCPGQMTEMWASLSKHSSLNYSPRAHTNDQILEWR